MTTAADRESLVRGLDEAVQGALKYFGGPGRTTTARVDRWQAHDILQHFIYYHDATAWGLQSVALGGPVWVIPADSDAVNEVCRKLHEAESLDDLLMQVRLAHGRLVRAGRDAPDLDQPCFQRATGEMLTGRQRLEGIARHWRTHVDELRAAAQG